MIEIDETKMKITKKIVDELSHRINEIHIALTRREFVLSDQIRFEKNMSEKCIQKNRHENIQNLFSL